MNRNELFDQIRMEIDPEQAKQLSLLRWEEQIVSRLIKFYALPDNTGSALRRRCRELTGKAQLLFIHFIDAYRDFPVYMTFEKIPYLHSQSMEDWVERFTKTAVYKRYHELVEAIPPGWAGDKPVAMVFPSNNYMRTLCMSNAPEPMVPGHRRFDAMVDSDRYAFEPLEFFLKTHPWSPS